MPVTPAFWMAEAGGSQIPASLGNLATYWDSLLYQLLEYLLFSRGCYGACVLTACPVPVMC